MTPHEIDLACALGRVSGWTGARFCDDIARMAASNPEQELTARQRYYMEIMAWRYRRQLAPHLVPESKPLNLPEKRKTSNPRKVNAPAAEPASTQLPLF